MLARGSVDIFDRLGNLIRTILDDEDRPGSASSAFTDPDEQTAWEELDEYMREGGRQGAARSFAANQQPEMPASLRRDFRNLEVRVGAPLPDVRQAYKRLMAAFHPDRHAADPVRLQTATEVTKKLNQSYRRIRTYYEGGG